MEAGSRKTAKERASKQVFVSYHEGIEQSLNIATELAEFFKDWKLECKLIKHSPSLEWPEEQIRRELMQSDYLLQLFTTDPAASRWMEFESTSFKAMRKPKQNRVVLTTKDTNKNEPAFDHIKTLRTEGVLRVVEIDDEEEARTFLSAILIDCGRLFKESHGKIELPKCCLQQPKTEPIDLNSLEEFIRNFRGAKERGLESVFPNREAALPRLRNQLEKLKLKEKILVRMIGFTLYRYVHPNHKDGLGKLFKEAIDEAIDKKKGDAIAQLLMLDLKCSAAQGRARIESPDKPYEESLLYKDSKEVRSVYSHTKYEAKVKIRDYETPYVGLVLFEDEVFIELYHLGKDIADQNICGHVPVLVARQGSDFYGLFESHFKSLWPDESANGS